MDTDSSLPLSAPVLTQSSAPFRLRTRVTFQASEPPQAVTERGQFRPSHRNDLKFGADLSKERAVAAELPVERVVAHGELVRHQFDPRLLVARDATTDR